MYYIKKLIIFINKNTLKFWNILFIYNDNNNNNNS